MTAQVLWAVKTPGGFVDWESISSCEGYAWENYNNRVMPSTRERLEKAGYRLVRVRVEEVEDGK